MDATKVKVHDLMQSDVAKLAADTPVDEAIALLEKEGVPLSAEGKEKVAANMLTVMVSNEGGSGSQVLLNIK